MKCTIIDKTPYDAYVALPDGTIISIPIDSIQNNSVGENINLSAQLTSTNIRFDKILDYF